MEQNGKKGEYALSDNVGSNSTSSYELKMKANNWFTSVYRVMSMIAISKQLTFGKKHIPHYNREGLRFFHATLTRLTQRSSFAFCSRATLILRNNANSVTNNIPRTTRQY